MQIVEMGISWHSRNADSCSIKTDCLLFFDALLSIVYSTGMCCLFISLYGIFILSFSHPRSTHSCDLSKQHICLICNTTGIPPPSIEWTKVNDTTVLSNTSGLTLYNVTRPGTLNETVQYRCTAKNGYGDPAHAAATVHVQCE